MTKCVVLHFFLVRTVATLRTESFRCDYIYVGRHVFRAVYTGIRQLVSSCIANLSAWFPMKDFISLKYKMTSETVLIWGADYMYVILLMKN